MRNAVRLCLAANNILLMRNETTLFSFLRSLCEKMADRFTSRRYSLKNKLGDRMIKRLLNLVIAKYRDMSVSRRSIICLGRRLRQMIDLLATDKSRYFTQLHPIIVNSVPLHGYLQVLNYNIPYNRAPHLTGQEQVSLTIEVKYFRNQLVATSHHLPLVNSPLGWYDSRF